MDIDQNVVWVMMKLNVDVRRVVKGTGSDESIDDIDDANIDGNSDDDDSSACASERDVNRDGIVGKDSIINVVSSMLNGSICKDDES